MAAGGEFVIHPDIVRGNILIYSANGTPTPSATTTARRDASAESNVLTVFGGVLGSAPRQPHSSTIVATYRGTLHRRGANGASSAASESSPEAAIPFQMMPRGHTPTKSLPSVCCAR
jgi:hypothetical protein